MIARSNNIERQAKGEKGVCRRQSRPHTPSHPACKPQALLFCAGKGRFRRLCSVGELRRACSGKKSGLYIEACKPVVKSPKPEDEWILLRDACVGTLYSQQYPSLLARLGRIDVRKRARNWYRNRRAIKIYQDSL